jgi:hypothetical protein
MKIFKNIMSALSVMGTNSATMGVKGISLKRFFFLNNFIDKKSISKMTVITFVKKREMGQPGTPPSISYCSVECSSGKIYSFKLDNPHSFRLTAKKQGINVQSFVRTSGWIGMGK